VLNHPLLIFEIMACACALACLGHHAVLTLEPDS
jgi:hypothetical protein